MGALTSRQNAGVEEVDVVSNHAYKYPPKSGNYFGSHFIMGGERFDTPQPEAYLFGENGDLNFLGSRPTPFPYPPPQANEPTKTLKSLVNIRKESLRLVKCLPVGGKGEGDIMKTIQYNIEFIFDCDAATAITIYYFASEEIAANGLVYNSREPTMTSDTFHYKAGANQLFCQPSVLLDPSRFSEEEFVYSPDKEVIPIAIHCVAQDGLADDSRQSHTCISVVERHSDGTYVLKALKQKLFVDGLCYLLQEIYGIENKNIETVKGNSEVETEDNGSECVICMCDVRDTLILPCRHLCLCNSCADSLRYQANNCPICRAPFRALLQIRALQKSSGPVSTLSTLPHDGSCENIPPGYEGVSLIEALNGPTTVRQVTHGADLDEHDLHISRTSLERTPKSSKVVGSPELERDVSTPEVRMSVLLNREKENGSPKEKSKSPIVSSRWRDKGRHKDTVRTVNETTSSSHQVANDEPLEEDMDSEAEKMSPLLSEARKSSQDEGTPSSPQSSPPTDVRLGNERRLKERSRTPSNKGSHESIALDDVGPSKSSPTASASVEIEDNGPLEEAEGGHTGAVALGGPHGDDSDYYTPDDPPVTVLSPLHSSEKTERWSSPGTPLSATSHRSSADSYSSSSSGRLLFSKASKC